MVPMTLAQQIYMHYFGLNVPRLLNHSSGKQFNNTKRGPGRKHKQGKNKD